MKNMSHSKVFGVIMILIAPIYISNMVSTIRKLDKDDNIDIYIFNPIL